MAIGWVVGAAGSSGNTMSHKGQPYPWQLVAPSSNTKNATNVPSFPWLFSKQCKHRFEILFKVEAEANSIEGQSGQIEQFREIQSELLFLGKKWRFQSRFAEKLQCNRKNREAAQSHCTPVCPNCSPITNHAMQQKFSQSIVIHFSSCVCVLEMEGKI